MSEQPDLTEPDLTEPDLTEPDLTAAPVTGNPQVDRAVASVADLADVPVAEQHERLTAAHERLHRALDAEEVRALDGDEDRALDGEDDAPLDEPEPPGGPGQP